MCNDAKDNVVFIITELVFGKMMTSSFNWLQRSKQSHPHCSGGGNGWSSKDNISCIGIGRGWQFPIPSADEEGQNLQLCRKHFAVEGGVASLWCKKPIPPRIIQSQRSQGHHHNSGSNGVNNKMDSQVLSDVSEASVTSLHHPAPAWLDVKGLDKGRSDRKRKTNWNLSRSHNFSRCLQRCT